MRTFLLSFAVILSAVRLMGGAPPTIVFISGEYEYHSKETLPAFAKDLSNEFNVRTIMLERPEDPNVQSIPGLDKLKDADLVVLMVRRMVLPEEQLAQIKKYLQSGKPLVGLRTASHSFENWKEFDAQVLGGNYQGHHGNQLKTLVSLIPEVREDPILRGIAGFVSDGSLYRNTPLREGSRPLLRGTVDGKPAEPVAWTHEYHGGRIFYTSLGHPNDFKERSFVRLVRNAIEWGLDRSLEKRVEKRSP